VELNIGDLIGTPAKVRIEDLTLTLTLILTLTLTLTLTLIGGENRRPDHRCRAQHAPGKNTRSGRGIQEQPSYNPNPKSLSP